MSHSGVGVLGSDVIGAEVLRKDGAASIAQSDHVTGIDRGDRGPDDDGERGRETFLQLVASRASAGICRAFASPLWRFFGCSAGAP